MVPLVTLTVNILLLTFIHCMRISTFRVEGSTANYLVA